MVLLGVAMKGGCCDDFDDDVVQQRHWPRQRPKVRVCAFNGKRFLMRQSE
jgi:hypothetical protein